MTFFAILSCLLKALHTSQTHRTLRERMAGLDSKMTNWHGLIHSGAEAIARMQDGTRSSSQGSQERRSRGPRLRQERRRRSAASQWSGQWCLLGPSASARACTRPRALRRLAPRQRTPPRMRCAPRMKRLPSLADARPPDTCQELAVAVRLP